MVRWVWLTAVAIWLLACAALLAAFSTFDVAWVALTGAALGATVLWLGAAVALSARRRWNRGNVLSWMAWPAAAAVVWLLHATDLPMTLRVVASGDALSEFATAARESGSGRGRVGLVVVFDSRVKDGCVFLTAGYALDGIAGLIHVPKGSEPAAHPDWALTDSRHLTGHWWYFQTRT